MQRFVIALIVLIIALIYLITYTKEGFEDDSEIPADLLAALKSLSKSMPLEERIKFKSAYSALEADTTLDDITKLKKAYEIIETVKPYYNYTGYDYDTFKSKFIDASVMDELKTIKTEDDIIKGLSYISILKEFGKITKETDLEKH